MEQITIFVDTLLRGLFNALFFLIVCISQINIMQI